MGRSPVLLWIENEDTDTRKQRLPTVDGRDHTRAMELPKNKMENKEFQTQR